VRDVPARGWLKVLNWEPNFLHFKPPLLLIAAVFTWAKPMPGRFAPALCSKAMLAAPSLAVGCSLAIVSFVVVHAARRTTTATLGYVVVVKLRSNYDQLRNSQPSCQLSWLNAAFVAAAACCLLP